MSSDRKRTLTLNRETLRSLTVTEMQAIAGGAPKPTETSHTCGCASKTCPTGTCHSKCDCCPSHHCVAPGVIFRAV